jgi:hypothetical protein
MAFLLVLNVTATTHMGEPLVILGETLPPRSILKSALKQSTQTTKSAADGDLVSASSRPTTPSPKKVVHGTPVRQTRLSTAKLSASSRSVFSASTKYSRPSTASRPNTQMTRGHRNQSASTVKSSRSAFDSLPSVEDAIAWSDDVMRQLNYSRSKSSLPGDAWADAQDDYTAQSMQKNKSSLLAAEAASQRRSLASDSRDLDQILAHLSDFLPFNAKAELIESNRQANEAHSPSRFNLPRSVSISEFLDPAEDPMQPLTALQTAHAAGQRGIPALSRFYSQSTGTVSWKTCLLLAVDQFTREYTVEWTKDGSQSEGKTKVIKRHNLRFPNETMEQFTALMESAAKKQCAMDEEKVRSAV